MLRSGGIMVVVALTILLTGTEQVAVVLTTPDIPETTKQLPIKTESTTPCPLVTCAPGCEPVRGPNGCSECACPPNCANVTCDAGYACELQEVQCFTTPCFPQPTCVPIPQSTTLCPLVTCAPGCVHVGDQKCSGCACPPACANVTCDPGYFCELQEVQCFTTPCFPQPTCVPIPSSTTPCPWVTCAPGCEPVRGPNGCSECACPRTCESITCSEDKKCMLQQVFCFAAPCFPIPTCLSKNDTTTTPAIPNASAMRCGSEISCGNWCLKRFDSNRCAYCDCPPTCEVTECRDGFICQMEMLRCRSLPCPSRPVCVPMESCTGIPNTKRCNRFPGSLFWFYNSSANACQKFRYYGCTPSPNTFQSRKACEDNCKREDPPKCIAIACANDCYTLERKNRCPKCICPNPCKNFKCGADQVCKLGEVTCAAKSCKPEPYCEP